MKALKIIAVVLGGLLLLSGIGLLVGSTLTGVGQQAFDAELRRQGFAGPVRGTVTEDSGSRFTVEYTDRDGKSRTGYGRVAEGTREPSVGDEVSLLYVLDDPDRIVIIDLGPAADFAGVGNALRIGGISCLVVGAVLLALGIIGLVRGRRQVPATGPPPGTYPPWTVAGIPAGRTATELPATELPAWSAAASIRPGHQNRAAGAAARLSGRTARTLEPRWPAATTPR